MTEKRSLKASAINIESLIISLFILIQVVKFFVDLLFTLLINFQNCLGFLKLVVRESL